MCGSARLAIRRIAGSDRDLPRLKELLSNRVSFVYVHADQRPGVQPDPCQLSRRGYRFETLAPERPPENLRRRDQAA